ncbi:hypothetical protein D3C81_1445750 [compost metagenome]
MHARLDYAFIQGGHLVQGGVVIARDHLADAVQGVVLVAGVDAFGRKTHMKVFLPAQARMLLEDGDADFLGRARVHGGLVDDDGAAPHVAADGRAGAGQGREIGIVRAVDGRGHGHDDEIGQFQLGRIAADAQPLRRAQLFGAHFTGRIDMAAVAFHLAC